MQSDSDGIPDAVVHVDKLTVQMYRHLRVSLMFLRRVLSSLKLLFSIVFVLCFCELSALTFVTLFWLHDHFGEGFVWAFH